MIPLNMLLFVVFSNCFEMPFIPSRGPIGNTLSSAYTLPYSEPLVDLYHSRKIPDTESPLILMFKIFQFFIHMSNFRDHNVVEIP